MLDVSIRSILPRIPAAVIATAAAMPAHGGGVMVIGDRPSGTAPGDGTIYIA